MDELHAEPAVGAPTQQRRQDEEEAKEQKGATHGTRHCFVGVTSGVMACEISWFYFYLPCVLRSLIPVQDSY